MTKHFVFSRLLIRRLLLMLGVYSLFRLLFLLFNYHSFSSNSFGSILVSFVAGLRFDISAIFYVNSLFILLHLLPFDFRYKKGYQLLLKWIFFVTNFVALLSGLVDLKWFSFVDKRMTYNIFGTTGDMMNLLPAYLKSYWYLLVIYAAIIYATHWCYSRIKIKKTENTGGAVTRFAVQLVILVLFLGLSVTAMRGGWQLRPITPISAAAYVNTSLVPLVNNTPFNIILTIQSSEIKEVKYFDEEQLNQLFSIQQSTSFPLDSARHDNVMIIIWESLSRFFVGSMNGGKGYTPFLDSLAANGLLCTNATANAHRSIEGIPAVTASIPTLMEESFTVSAYQQNKIMGLPALLKQFGYSSAFYHSGKNGTMSFDVFAPAAGYEHYYGLNEYPDKSEFDGNWGVWDEPYFQYVVKQLNQLKQPFCATLFTISSHHPFVVPDKYKNVFSKDKNQYSQVIQYTDYSLKKFFDSASKQPWFNQTLFVIVADHGAYYEPPLSNTPHGASAIPVIFYKPDGSLKGTYDKPVQQTDILPSVIDYLRVSCNYVSFGKSIFSKDSIRYTYNYLNGIYHIEDNEYHLEFDGAKTLALYNYVTDPLFEKNIADNAPEVQQRLENKLKAVIQTYNYALIYNKLMPE